MSGSLESMLRYGLGKEDIRRLIKQLHALPDVAVMLDGLMEEEAVSEGDVCGERVSGGDSDG